jgi:hypothetical protein
MSEKADKLMQEFIDLLKEGNITLDEVVHMPEVLGHHPDFDKAISILAALEDELNNVR